MMCLFLPPSAIPTFREIAMKMVSHSMALLRNDIEAVARTRARKASKFLILQVYWLYRVACISRNFAAANVHANMLYQFIEELDDEDVEFKYFMYICMLFFGVDMTVASTERGACNFGPYCLTMASDLREQASPFLKYLPRDYKHPGPMIKAEPLRSTLIRSRRLTTLMEHPIPVDSCSDHFKRFVISHYCVFQNFLDTLDLLYMYLDTIEGKNPCSLETLGQQYTYAAMALTIVLVSRTLVDVTAINGVNLRDASPVLIPGLRSLLELAFSRLNPLEQILYQETHIWMLYIGAVHEQQMLRKKIALIETWFSNTLAAKA